MKIQARPAIMALVAGLLAGCTGSVTAPDDPAALHPAPAVANHVDNPGQTPMK
jgi:hypothetical protein